MKLITDLHPCCKCHTWQDIDTMTVNLHLYGDWQDHLNKLICPDCEEKQRKEIVSKWLRNINNIGIDYARGNDWSTQSEIRNPKSAIQ